MLWSADIVYPLPQTNPSSPHELMNKVATVSGKGFIHGLNSMDFNLPGQPHDGQCEVPVSQYRRLTLSHSLGKHNSSQLQVESSM